MESQRNQIIVFVRSNPVAPDPRVEKEAKSLATKYRIKIIARDRTGEFSSYEKRDYAEISRIKILGPKNSLLLTLSMFLWWAAVFIKLLFIKVDIIHACDFDTAVPAILAAKLRRKKFVYDIFDFYVDEFHFPDLIYRLLKGIDIKIINAADLVILVDEARERQIDPAKPKKLIFVYNSPEIDTKQLKTPKLKENYLFYAGGLAADRMLKEILDYAVNKKIDFEIAGWGPLVPYVRDLARKHKNIKFLGMIPYDQVLLKSQDTRAIIAYYDPAVPNHKFASPNKLFEAMGLGKPLITNKGTVAAELVEKEQIGITTNYGDVSEFAKALSMIKDDQFYNEISARARNLYEKKYSWAVMAKRLQEAYANLSKK